MYVRLRPWFGTRTDWPMGYMARHYETELDSDGRVFVPSHEQLPRGVVNTVL